jgi:hypothetical protein
VSDKDDDREMKVTDRRMFTPDGELREEYRFIEQEAAERAAREAASPPVSPPVGSTEPPAATAPGAAPTAAGPGTQGHPEGAAGAADDRARLELPVTPGGLGAPTFLDLVAVLAEPVALYLGDAELPDGRRMEDLDMARLHIDMLDVLRRKTAGNLTAQELAVLEDLLYRLRMRYVQKTG